MSKYIITALMASLICISANATTGTPYMPIKGHFSVDGKGAANYKIPIDIVKSKLNPKLSLSYNSQSGIGFVGNGWALSGSPTIRMCSLKKRQDNKWANIM